MTHKRGVTLVVVAYHSVTTQCDSDSILSLCRPERSNFNRADESVASFNSVGLFGLL